jgi:hypothetical protein
MLAFGAVNRFETVPSEAHRAGLPEDGGAFGLSVIAVGKRGGGASRSR